MNLKFWLNESKGFKRWIVLGILSILIIVIGILNAIISGLDNLHEIYLCTGIISFGIFSVFISVKNGIKALFKFINKEFNNPNLDTKEIKDMIYEKRILVKGPKIVVIGGGTGLSNLLRGMKKFTSN